MRKSIVSHSGVVLQFRKPSRQGWKQRCACGNPFTRDFRSAEDKTGKSDQCLVCYLRGLKP